MLQQDTGSTRLIIVFIGICAAWLLLGAAVAGAQSPPPAPVDEIAAE